MISELIFAKQIARSISIISTAMYLLLLAVIIFEMMMSLSSGRLSSNLGIELSLFAVLLVISCITAVFTALLFRFKPSLHHARRHLGEHVRHLGHNELHEHLKHRH